MAPGMTGDWLSAGKQSRMEQVQRDQADADQDHQGYDGQAPGPSGVRAEDGAVHRVELDDDPRDGCRDEAEKTGNRVH